MTSVPGATADTEGIMRAYFRSLMLFLCLAPSVVACKKATTEVNLPDAIAIVQGNAQSVQAGLLLPTPVVVRVVDKNGLGMPSIPVTFVLSDGGGSVTPASATSDARGEVTVKWTLGPVQPLQSLTASASGVTPVRIQAQAILPSDISVAQGNNQTAKAGTVLTNSIVVRVTGTGNAPMVGVPVAFQVTSGGGAITPQTIVTNALGEATAKWTLGTVAGANTATVSSSTLTPVVLAATGTP